MNIKIQKQVIYIVHAHVFLFLNIGFNGIAAINRFEDINRNKIPEPEHWDYDKQSTIVSEVAKKTYPELNTAACNGNKDKLQELIQKIPNSPRILVYRDIYSIL